MVNGKGDKQRHPQVSHKEYRDNHERIWGGEDMGCRLFESRAKGNIFGHKVTSLRIDGKLTEGALFTIEVQPEEIDYNDASTAFISEKEAEKAGF